MKKRSIPLFLALFVACSSEENELLEAPAGMLEVPAGDFWRGCNQTLDSWCDEMELPYFNVKLDRYFIDKNEVSAGEYKQCVEAEACTYNGDTSNELRTYDNGRDEYPINYVSWSDAKDYCQWKGKRLPTESEWEKASRGGCELYSKCQEDSRIFPWGNELPYCVHAAFTDPSCECCGVDQMFPVGGHADSTSPYGLLDMAGNVWEWTADWYSEYSQESPSANPTGPISGSHRVIRGGSFSDTAFYLRSSARGSGNPSGRYNTHGFRCAL